MQVLVYMLCVVCMFCSCGALVLFLIIKLCGLKRI